MITKLHLENFRSIRKADLPLGKITVLTGANNSGKSSLLYGFLVLRDFVFNPNRSLEQMFALPFINLGGFEEVKSKISTLDDISGFVRLGVTAATDDTAADESKFNLALGHGRTFMDLRSLKNEFEFRTSLDIGLPYAANRFVVSTAQKGSQYDFAKFQWNGLQAEIDSASSASNTEKRRLETVLNYCAEALTQADFVPITRTFSKPIHNVVPMTGQINSEDEVATFLQHEPEAFIQVRRFLRKIADRQLFLPPAGAPGLIRLATTDSKNSLPPTALVNEGTGTNQLVTILAKIFQPNKNFTCIDEPETHLHPSMVQKLAASFVEIAQEHRKQFLVSTHSEHFVQSLMQQVAAGNIAPDDVKVYFLERKKSDEHPHLRDEHGLDKKMFFGESKTGETVIEPQPINSKGQIKGGLRHFYESELASLESFFNIAD